MRLLILFSSLPQPKFLYSSTVYIIPEEDFQLWVVVVGQLLSITSRRKKKREDLILSCRSSSSQSGVFHYSQHDHLLLHFWTFGFSFITRRLRETKSPNKKILI